jgi:hypothetical protein
MIGAADASTLSGTRIAFTVGPAQRCLAQFLCHTNRQKSTYHHDCNTCPLHPRRRCPQRHHLDLRKRKAAMVEDVQLSHEFCESERIDSQFDESERSGQIRTTAFPWLRQFQRLVLDHYSFQSDDSRQSDHTRSRQRSHEWNTSKMHLVKGGGAVQKVQKTSE